jgi:hypothetical protein
MARGIYKTVLLTGFRSHLLIYRRLISLSVYSLFSGTQALSHERIIIIGPPCLSSSILNWTRFPWENISETGEISKD